MTSQPPMIPAENDGMTQLDDGSEGNKSELLTPVIEPSF
jgi:hypothetical protein